MFIQLSDIEAENKGSFNRIFWTTAKEDNGDYFFLERSNSGIHFEPIAKIAAKGFAYKYTYDDMQPFIGINLYRIKTLDANGKISYSKIVKAIVGGSMEDLILTPNPAETSINLYYDGQISTNSTIQIMNMLGKVVKRLNVSKNNIKISIADLPAGVYSLSFITNEFKKNVKFVKQ